MSDDQIELLDYRQKKTPLKRCVSKRYTSCNMTVLLVTLLVASLCVHAAEFGVIIHLYRKDVAPIVNNAQVALDNWDMIAKRIDPYINRIDELFNEISKLSALGNELNLMAALVGPEILKINNFMTWSRNCAHDHGFCTNG